MCILCRLILHGKVLFLGGPLFDVNDNFRAKKMVIEIS